MPRNRMLKAEFWDDEKLAKISLQARLTYIGLWTLGPYGVNEHCWYVRPAVKKQSQLTLFGS